MRNYEDEELPIRIQAPTCKVGFPPFHNKELRVSRTADPCIEPKLKDITINSSPNCFGANHWLALLCSHFALNVKSYQLQLLFKAKSWHLYSK